MKRMVKSMLACCAILAALQTALALDANTASQAELETLAGIGPAIAGRIVAERKSGSFVDMDDLRDRVKGIGERKLGKLSAAGLTVDGRGASKPRPSSARAMLRAEPKVIELRQQSAR